MAKKPTKATAIGDVDPEAQYSVQLSKAIKHGPTWLRPNAERLRVSGATLIEIADAVADYKIVE